MFEMSRLFAQTQKCIFVCLKPAASLIEVFLFSVAGLSQKGYGQKPWEIAKKTYSCINYAWGNNLKADSVASQ